MIARGTGFVKGKRTAVRSRLVAHLKYVEHRLRDEQESREDRRLFSKEEDRVTRQQAVEDVMGHTSSGVAYHKIVLSPAEDEPIRDWKQWTREVMADLEERQGKELHWYAVQHQNTDNPHVHVILAGAGEEPGAEKLKPVKLFAQDFQAMRESGQEHSEHEWYRQIQEHVREEERRESGRQSPEHDQSREIDLDRGGFER